MFPAGNAFAQEQKGVDEKQKQVDTRRRPPVLTEEQQQRQAEMEAKRKEMREKIAEIEKDFAIKRKEYEEMKMKEVQEYYKLHDRMRLQYDSLQHRMRLQYDSLQPRRPSFERSYRPEFWRTPAPIQRPGTPAPYRGFGFGNKPGSALEYSRQLVDATLTNELVMNSGPVTKVNLAIYGHCSKGSLVLEIITPDGKQLSEVLFPEKDMVNWRKSVTAEEGKGWKNGKWIFRLKAKEATGMFHISVSTD